ncbi:putative Zn(2)-C6 fungal-type domain-containing protein [Seiridium unicorne]|uniref:Zn(2)-C6 fungal-type domain-containing protein n=1 Tax=Seiridium unicorne TaxID=138068 RepID=A0ABR2UTL5_9PEZI
MSTTPMNDGKQKPTAASAKLRDSCEACATSKVRCNKEKPSCLRCTKRGLICEYVVTRRVGRKKYGRSSGTGDEGSSSSAALNPTSATDEAIDAGNMVFLSPVQTADTTGWFSTTPATPVSEHLSSAGAETRPRRTPGPAMALNTFAQGLHMTEEVLPLPCDDFNIDFDSYFASPESFLSHELRGLTDGFAVTTAAQDMGDAFSTAESASDEISMATILHSDTVAGTRSSVAPQVMRSHQFLGVPQNAPSHSCLARALSLMGQLVPSRLQHCSKNRPHELEEPWSMPSVHSVIVKNKEVLGAISTILQCACAQDGHLLVILCVIVSRVLNWYGIAARRCPMDDSEGNVDQHGSGDFTVRNHPSNTRSENASQQLDWTANTVPLAVAAAGDYPLQGEDSARMRSQLVLSELHRVQRLVGELAVKLRHQNGKPGYVDMSGDDSALGYGTSDMLPPMSVELMDQLESNLREQLKVLSSEIVEDLRKDSQ